MTEKRQNKANGSERYSLIQFDLRRTSAELREGKQTQFSAGGNETQASVRLSVSVAPPRALGVM